MYVLTTAEKRGGPSLHRGWFEGEKLTTHDAEADKDKDDGFPLKGATGMTMRKVPRHFVTSLPCLAAILPCLGGDKGTNLTAATAPNAVPTSIYFRTSPLDIGGERITGRNPDVLQSGSDRDGSFPGFNEGGK